MAVRSDCCNRRLSFASLWTATSPLETG